jgi:RNA polymerase sigma-70 factor (ECF subfamily)
LISATLPAFKDKKKKVFYSEHPESSEDNIGGVADRISKEEIIAASEGDEAAFVKLVEAYQQSIYNLALRMVHSRTEAEDITQDIFLHLLDILDRYDPERPFEPWLFRVATNHILNYLKRRKIKTVPMESLRQPGDSEAPAVELADSNSPTTDPVELSEKYEVLQKAVNELPPDWRAVITLHYMQSFSVNDIASTLEIPVGTVKNRLFRARNILYEKLQKLLETWSRS